MMKFKNGLIVTVLCCAATVFAGEGGRFSADDVDMSVGDLHDPSPSPTPQMTDIADVPTPIPSSPNLTPRPSPMAMSTSEPTKVQTETPLLEPTKVATATDHVSASGDGVAVLPTPTQTARDVAAKSEIYTKQLKRLSLEGDAVFDRLVSTVLDGVSPAPRVAKYDLSHITGFGPGYAIYCVANDLSRCDVAVESLRSIRQAQRSGSSQEWLILTYASHVRGVYGLGSAGGKIQQTLNGTPAGRQQEFGVSSEAPHEEPALSLRVHGLPVRADHRVDGYSSRCSSKNLVYRKPIARFNLPYQSLPSGFKLQLEVFTPLNREKGVLIWYRNLTEDLVSDICITEEVVLQAIQQQR